MAAGLLTQSVGTWLRPVAYVSKQLDRVFKGWSPCWRALAATSLLVLEANKLTLGQKLNIKAPHAVVTESQPLFPPWLLGSTVDSQPVYHIDRGNNIPGGFPPSAIYVVTSPTPLWNIIKDHLTRGCIRPAILGVISTSRPLNMRKNITGWVYASCSIMRSHISLLWGVISFSPFQDVNNNFTGWVNRAGDAEIIIILSPSSPPGS
nr:uncharacterized protein LOC129525937 [Gorilla gorilla gorilla]